MKIVRFRKNTRNFSLLKTAHVDKLLQVQANFLRSCFAAVIFLVMIFMFSVNIAYSAGKIVSWKSMFANVRAYEEAMRASGIHNYDRMQDAADMLSDANAYERDARAFVDECVSKRFLNIYAMEMDFNYFHERRLKELQQKWSRSNYLVECATIMAEFVRDNNLGRMKSIMADPHRASTLTSRNDASASTYDVAPEERDINNMVERATVFVIAMSAEEDKTGSGTGFFVAPGIILTNRHVVGEKSAKVIVLSKTLEQPARAQIMAISEKADRDYALLRLEQISSGYPSPLAFSTDAKPTDKVAAWGYPYSAVRNDPAYAARLRGDKRSIPDVVYSEGVISEIKNQDPPIIIYSAITSRGSSGGPLVNTKGQVLGIHTWRSQDASYRQSGRSISATDIIKFMRENGVRPEIASDSR